MRTIGPRRVLAMLALVGSAPLALFGQDSVPPKPVAPPQPQAILLPDGTEVSVKTVGELSGKSATTGDLFTWRVAKPVIVNNYVVIAEGAPVKGAVTEAKKAGMMGRSGKLNIRVDTTKSIDGQVVRLRASQAASGQGRTGTTVALVVLFGPLGLLKHGTEGIIKDGTVFSVYTDGDVRINKAP